MVNLIVSREDFAPCAISIGCGDMAEHVKRALRERDFVIEELPEGPPPPRSENEKNRATALIGKIFGY